MLYKWLYSWCVEYNHLVSDEKLQPNCMFLPSIKKSCRISLTPQSPIDTTTTTTKNTTTKNTTTTTNTNNTTTTIIIITTTNTYADAYPFTCMLTQRVNIALTLRVRQIIMPIMYLSMTCAITSNKRRG